MIIYRDIPRHPGYRAHSDGSIWSCWNNRWGQSDTWRRMVPSRNNKYGRMVVRLRQDGGTFHTRFVHHLVLEAFAGQRPVGTEALHKDGNAGNNSAENLSWGTRAENLADFRRHGRKKGAGHHLAKLTDNLVVTIRDRAANGETHQAIADSIGVGREAVSKIIRRERWAHVP